MADEMIPEHDPEPPIDPSEDTADLELQQDSELPSGAGQESDDDGGARTPWLTAGVVIALFVALLAALGVFNADDAEPAPAEQFVTITDPGEGAVLAVPEAVTIRGQAGGLPDNRVSVQARDLERTILAEETTLVDAPEMGGVGDWSVEMVIPVSPGTPGQITAFWGPQDVAVTASATVAVTFGEELSGGSDINIEEPEDDQTIDISTPVTISGSGSGLFENNVVVEALDADGNVLVQQPTVMQTDEVGGDGEWSIELSIPAEPGSSGTIRAFSTSPADGSVVAEASVSVQYGEPVEPTEEPTEQAPDTSAGIEDLLWSLRTLDGIDVVPMTLVTMRLDSGTIAGISGCNNYTGGYALDGGSISIPGPLASTRKACAAPEGIMEQENTYLAALTEVASYEISADGLMMNGLVYDAAVTGTVTFEAEPEIPEGATLTVSVEDVSRQDVAAETIGETVITDFSVIPVPFVVTFDPTLIDTRFTYGMRARLEDADGNLLYINTSAIQVITRDNPSEVEVPVEPV